MTILGSRLISLLLASALITLVATSVWLVIARAPTSGEDGAKEKCGAEANGNTLDAAFRINSGSEFWRYFPSAGLAPELVEDERPMYLVVFNGQYLGPTLTHQVRNDVVCVVNADGDRTIYFDIPRDGYAKP
jgi:hypothetical protein